jgi:SagB-type dehydrogenase family enzyme
VTPSTEIVRAYHQQTKHHPQRYARALGYMDWGTQPDPFRTYGGAPRLLGYMDWGTQPDPFRTYGGAPRLRLERPAIVQDPRYEQVFRPGQVAIAELGGDSISQLFFDSLALSAWKQFQGSRWSLRVNPSSGNLHPTEGYLLCGPVPGFCTTAGVHHYQPYEHALELRCELTAAEWQQLAGQLPEPCILVGLTSIHWRESWKYGERAFRYCQHDAGHAIGAVAISAAVLGWQTTLLESIDHPQLGTLLGVASQAGLEAEEPDCLLAVYPQGQEFPLEKRRAFSIPRSITDRLLTAGFHGTPRELSTAHHEWPIIDDVAAACRRVGAAPADFWQPLEHENSSLEIGDSQLPARQIIHQRRSAVAMDGRTGITRDAFYQILLKVMPARDQAPFPTLPWRPRIHLALFVHRVQDLEPGIYFLNRNGRDLDDLRTQLDPDYAWTRPPGCPASLDLRSLLTGDARDLAQTISCHQDIAADGCFAVAMLAEFKEPLAEYGPWFYKRLHWEAGLVGQVLYLEAEASGIRATGIGCFFDDATHDTLGIRDDRLQDLYHFTVGGAVDDTRLQTHPAYSHLEKAT